MVLITNGGYGDSNNNGRVEKTLTGGNDPINRKKDALSEVVYANTPGLRHGESLKKTDDDPNRKLSYNETYSKKGLETQ